MVDMGPVGTRDEYESGLTTVMAESRANIGYVDRGSKVRDSVV